MKRFVVPDLPAEGVLVPLPLAASHHLLRVVRAQVGAPLALVDGHGAQAPAELAAVEGDVALVRVVGPITRTTPDAVVLVLALLKGPAMDLALRMATEAGATVVQPVLTARSVATGDRADRWERIAVAAAQQCGRADLPTVNHPIPFHAAITSVLPDGDRRIALPGAPRGAAATGPVAVLVGPEGGWTEAEQRAALAAGWNPVGLGPHVFRADTAAAVAVAMCHPDRAVAR